MMDDAYDVWIPKTATIKGMTKKWWAAKLKEIYYSGRVSREKMGDYGEALVSMHMLFVVMYFERGSAIVGTRPNRHTASFRCHLTLGSSSCCPVVSFPIRV